MAATTGVLRLRHNKKSPNAEQALKMLQELQREFAPLLRNRNWTVDELVEMCCCSEHSGGVKRSPGIAGMCHSGERGRSSSRIEIRLRVAADHAQFLDYEGYVVGTMCHELSHIVHGNHSSDFYRLMEELRNEFDKSAPRRARTGRPFAGEGRKADTDRHNPVDPRAARASGPPPPRSACRRRASWVARGVAWAAAAAAVVVAAAAGVRAGGT